MMMNDWIGVSAFGIGHWAIFAVMVAAILYPIGRILGRIGLSPFWSVCALIPVVNVVALWILAFTDWPQDATRGPA
jgi:uncharacterized membrane protein